MQRIEETVVIVTEALDGPAVDTWGRLVSEAVALRPGRLVVDLRRCPRIDAEGIGVLLRAHRDMVGCGGTLTLRGPGERVRRNLALARLGHVFAVEAPERVIA